MSKYFLDKTWMQPQIARTQEVPVHAGQHERSSKKNLARGGAALASLWLAVLGVTSAARAQDAATPAPDAPAAVAAVTSSGPPPEAAPAPDPAPPPSEPAATPVAETAPEAATDTASDPAPEPAPEREPDFGIRANLEIGFLGVLAHNIQLGRDGTTVDYPSDLSQSNLYLFLRVSADFDIWRQHIITFVYQPIDIETTSTLRRDLTIDGALYPAGSVLRARYGFPFYRLGWAFDVLEGRDEELAFGLGFQIRNATITFQSGDGETYRARNDIGPVPLLRSRGRFPIAGGWWFGWEVDGFYAFIPGLNGTDNNVEGAILDASLRVGWRMMPHVDGFLNIRYLGGGAAGQGDPGAYDDGFQRNWLHFLTISAGVTLDSRR